MPFARSSGRLLHLFTSLREQSKIRFKKRVCALIAASA